MNSNQNQNLESQEIDITVVAQKIQNVFKGFKMSIFRFIRFIVQKIVIIGALFVIGIGAGLFFDKVVKTYENKVILVPNFGSYDYLYTKIGFLESKIEDKDYAFLQKIGIKDPETLKKIKIKPILDVYQYFNASSEKGFELLKLMAEDGDMAKIIEDEVTSKNYTYHILDITTNRRCSEQEILEPILNYLNQDKYFNQLKVSYNKNINDKIKANEIIIAQIDGFLNTFSSEVNQNSKNDKLVYYNENTQLNDVIKTKNDLISETGKLRTDLVSLDKVIKKISYTSNIKNTETVNGKMKYILPFALVLLYMLLYALSSFYKSQAQKIDQQ